MAKKTKVAVDPDQDGDNDYKAQSDARTLTDAAAIQNDPDRHGKAAAHLQKNAQSAKDAHDIARKQLLKKTKKRMQKTFGGGQSGTFQGEKDKEAAGMKGVVDE